MARLFAAFVTRTSKWDQSKPPQEQPGFDRHVAYMGGMEEADFIALAGLMTPSNDVLFVFRADSEDEARAKLAQDPWQQDGLVTLSRIEEVAFRITKL